LLQNPCDITNLTLGMLLHYLGKLKIQIFCICGRKHKQIAFLVTSNFVIHPQILIFSVFKIASLSILIVNKIFRVTVLLLVDFYDQFVPALKKTLRQLMIQSRVNRTSHRPTGLSVRHYGRRVFIGCLCPGLFEKTCVRNVSRGAVHRS